MGIFDKKYCGVCREPISFLGTKKLRDGHCCKNCEAKLSPWFHERKASSVDEIRYQIDCRERNREKVSTFKITRTLGFDTKIFVDDGSGKFIINGSGKNAYSNPDVFDFSDVTSCSVDIVESRKEIEYKDNNDNIKSFSPPCYACSYDFSVEINFNIPYINTIQIKLNLKPVDNGQETLIKMNSGGVLGKMRDAFVGEKSFNGKTTNADEVRACEEYRKYNETGLEIRKILLESKRPNPKSVRPSTNESARESGGRVKCPWCESEVIPDATGKCGCCGGPLTFSESTKQ